VFSTAFDLIPKAPSRVEYIAQDKGLTLYTVNPQVCELHFQPSDSDFRYFLNVHNSIASAHHCIFPE
jgi:hypothetical protein